MNKILVIGDSHISDTHDVSRFYNLGLLIADVLPTHIISIGDFLSLDCLSEWDRNKRKVMENKRYYAEVEQGNAALDLMEHSIALKNNSLKKHKKSLYSPTKIYIKGNHENRLDRYINYDPTFEGMVGIDKDLRLTERGWSMVEYKDEAVVGGISFTHVPITGMGKAISNPMCAQKALKLYHNSVVFGHTHTLDHAAEHRHNAPHLNQALSAGCFFEHIDDYAKGSKTDYWRGIVILHNYSDNRYDIETISLSRLKKEWK